VTVISKGRKKKTDDEFFTESLEFYVSKGNELSLQQPEIVDIYNDHSLLKLLSIHYWVGIFSPIAHRQLKQRHGYTVAYIDTMAGSGVTRTTSRGDCFIGSFPGAILAASRKGVPFDIAIGVELNAERAKALQERTKELVPDTEVTVICKDIADVSRQIADELPNKTVAYTVIDPQALQGLTWDGISPLLCVKGDTMLTWFEMEIWRLKQAAVTIKDHLSTVSDTQRMNELFQGDKWKDAREPSDLTDLFMDQVKEECGKMVAATVRIPRLKGNYYQPILFTGKFAKAEKVANEWSTNLDRRINSLQGRSIDKLLDVKSGRCKSLDEFNDGQE